LKIERKAFSTDIAFYSDADHVQGKQATGKSFAKGKRNMIISLRPHNNPCDNLYSAKPLSQVTQTKNFSSGPPRFADSVSFEAPRELIPPIFSHASRRVGV